MTPKKNNQEYDEEIEIDNLKANKAAEADTEDNEPIEVVKAYCKEQRLHNGFRLGQRFQQEGHQLLR